MCLYIKIIDTSTDANLLINYFPLFIFCITCVFKSRAVHFSYCLGNKNKVIIKRIEIIEQYIFSTTKSTCISID